MRVCLLGLSLWICGVQAAVRVGAPVPVGVRGHWLDATVKPIGLEPQPGIAGEAR
jgi:hypothetical protein